MRYVLLGRSDLRVSTIGFGGWAIGGKQWGSVDDAESAAAIRRAVELGINFFDTADVYGLGRSEEVLGRALRGNPDVVIATKVGLGWNSKGKIRHDLSAGHIKSACEASLRRLKREAIDLYQIHWPDPVAPLDETLGALSALVKEGKVRHVGACNVDLATLQALTAVPGVVAYQGLFNYFDPVAREELIPYCRRNGLSFIAYEPLAKGLLTGKFNKAPTFGRGDHRKYEERFTTRFSENKVKVDALAAVAAGQKVTVAQLALAWLLAKGADIVIPGMKTPAQVAENAGAASIDGFVSPELRILKSSGIKLNANHRRDLAELVTEIAEREGLRPSGVLEECQFKAILGSGLNGPQKLKQVKKALWERRYPVSSGRPERPWGVRTRPRSGVLDAGTVKAGASRPVDRLVIERSVAREPLTVQVLEKFSGVPVEYVEKAAVKGTGRPGDLVIAGNRGRFIKKCPGTPVYQCCDYYILNIGIGCFSGCHYCYLHHYMNTPFTVYANIGDLLAEVADFCGRRPDKVIRLGSGEFIDSVGIDEIANLNEILVPALGRIPNLVFEIKTKSGKIEHLLKLDHHGRVVVSWSVNSEEMIELEESGTHSLDERLEAAARCQAAGYRMGFHFDPLIDYPGWEAGYLSAVDMIFDRIDPAGIAWISLGALRFNPALKPIIRRKFPDSRLLYGELLPGLDGKLRYPLSLRRRMFARLTNHIRRRGEHVPVYLCMENKDLAREVGLSADNVIFR